MVLPEIEAAQAVSLIGSPLRSAQRDLAVEAERAEPATAEFATEMMMPAAERMAPKRIAGMTADSVRELTRQALTSVVDVLAGRAAVGVVNPDALAHPRQRGQE